MAVRRKSEVKELDLSRCLVERAQSPAEVVLLKLKLLLLCVFTSATKLHNSIHGTTKQIAVFDVNPPKYTAVFDVAAEQVEFGKEQSFKRVVDAVVGLADVEVVRSPRRRSDGE